MLRPSSILCSAATCTTFLTAAFLGLTLLPSPAVRAQGSSGSVTLSSGMFASSGTLTTVGGTLMLAGGNVSGSTINGGTITTNPTLTTTGGTVTTGLPLAGGTYTLSGVTFGSGTLTLTSGTLPSGSFTFTGNTTISSGDFTVTGVSLISFGPSFFSGEVDLGSQVRYLALPNGSPFGYYSHLGTYLANFSGSSYVSYLYHFDLGYEFVVNAGDSKGGVYLYDFASQTWFYTSPTFPFPYLYDFKLNAVLYYYPDPNNPGRYNTDGVRYFYNFATGQVITK